MTESEYMKDRVDNQIAWYGKKSVVNKKLYLRLKRVIPSERNFAELLITDQPPTPGLISKEGPGLTSKEGPGLTSKEGPGIRDKTLPESPK